MRNYGVARSPVASMPSAVQTMGVYCPLVARAMEVISLWTAFSGFDMALPS